MPTLYTVEQFAQHQPAFTQGGLRHLIFNKETNGLAQSGAILKIGKKVVINGEKFMAWLEGGAK